MSASGRRHDTTPVLLTIGQLARRSGVAVRTIRFWSDEGIQPPSQRSEAGYRRHDAVAVARLDLVRTLRDLGMGLDDVREVLARRRGIGEVAAAHVRATTAGSSCSRLHGPEVAAQAFLCAVALTSEIRGRRWGHFMGGLRGGLVGWVRACRARLAPAAAGDGVLTVFFLVEGRLRRGGEARSLSAGPADRGTTRGVAVAVVMAAVAAPALAALRVGRLPVWLGWVGVGVMGGGLGLRVWAARALGAYYTRTLRITDEQGVVDTGPYAWVRHPGYAGVLALWAGYGLAMTSVPAFVGALGPVVVAYARRIDAEEAMLETSLGARYRRYRDRTSRLVPGIY